MIIKKSKIEWATFFDYSIIKLGINEVQNKMEKNLNSLKHVKS